MSETATVGVGQFWERKTGGLRIKILRLALRQDTEARVIGIDGDDAYEVGVSHWRSTREIVQSFVCLGTIDGAHDEALGLDNLRDAYLKFHDNLSARYARLRSGTIDEAHAEALTMNAMRADGYAAPVSAEVLEAESDARCALRPMNVDITATRALARALEDYQEVMNEHGVCLTIGCHASAPIFPLCVPCLRSTALVS